MNHGAWQSSNNLNLGSGFFTIITNVLEIPMQTVMDVYRVKRI